MAHRWGGDRAVPGAGGACGVAGVPVAGVGATGTDGPRHRVARGTEVRGTEDRDTEDRGTEGPRRRVAAPRSRPQEAALDVVDYSRRMSRTHLNCGGYMPVTPSAISRRMSMWPLWRAVSSRR